MFLLSTTIMFGRELLGMPVWLFGSMRKSQLSHLSSARSLFLNQHQGAEEKGDVEHK